MIPPQILSSMHDGIVIMASGNMVSTAKFVTERLRAQAIAVEFQEIEMVTFSYPESCVNTKLNVRGKTIFLFHGFDNNPNNGFMEMMIICDALRRSSAKSITLMTPFFPYTRQDRLLAREPFTAKLIATMIETNPIITQLVTTDLHASQIAGFFERIHVENIPGHTLFVPDIRGKFSEKLNETSILSTDVGGAKHARNIASYLGLEVAIVDKRRGKEGSDALALVGEVKKNVIIIDDMADTVGSLITAANLARVHGAEKICAYVSHALLSPKNGTTAEQKLKEANLQLAFSDTLPRNTAYFEKHPHLRRIRSGEFTADIIQALISVNGSIKGTIKTWTNKDRIPDE